MFVNVNTTVLSVSTLTTALIKVLLFVDSVAGSSLRPGQLENARIHSNNHSYTNIKDALIKISKYSY